MESTLGFLFFHWTSDLTKADLVDFEQCIAQVNLHFVEAQCFLCFERYCAVKENHENYIFWLTGAVSYGNNSIVATTGYRVVE